MSKDQNIAFFKMKQMLYINTCSKAKNLFHQTVFLVKQVLLSIYISNILTVVNIAIFLNVTI